MSAVRAQTSMIGMPRVAPTVCGDNCTVEIVASVEVTPDGVLTICETVRTSNAELASSAHAIATSAPTSTE